MALTAVRSERGTGARSRRRRAVLGALVLVVAAAGCDLAAISKVSGDDVVWTPSNPILVSGGDLSDNGEIVAFVSNWAYDAADTNGLDDVIVSDRNVGVQVRLSSAIGGGAPNAKAEPDPSVSGDGRFVAWSSTASDIVSGDTNGVQDVFRRDLETGVTERVSVSSAGVEGSNWSRLPSMSYDGRLVAFSSMAPNLVANDTNAASDVFVRDMVTGTTTRWSVDAGGVQGWGHSDVPEISSDGKWLAFGSSSVFDAADANGTYDVYLKQGNGPITWISVPAPGLRTDGPSTEPSVNEDGTVVAFQSSSSGFDEQDDNGENDVFAWEGGTVELISVTRDGGSGSGAASAASVDRTGNLVAFGSSSPELTDDAPSTQALVRDRSAGHTDHVSTSLTGDGGTAFDRPMAISGDGRSVLIRAGSNNLLPADLNPGFDLVVKAYPFPRVTRMTPNVLAPGTTTTVTIEGKGFSGPLYVSLSADSGAALTWSPPIPLSPTRIRLNVTVPAGAAPQAYDLRVWNLGDHPDNAGSETTCYRCLQVG